MTPLILALALAQAPAGGLTLNNVRTTYGNLGAPRPAGPLTPGDVLFLAFDIDGITIDKDAKATYIMAMDVTDASGKVIYNQEPASKADFVPLGGATLPGQAFITIGLDQTPGDYTMKVTVTDGANKSKKDFAHKFTVAPKTFDIVGVYASVDERGLIPSPTTAVVGQSPFVHVGLVGFGRTTEKQPNVTIEMTPVDDKGTATMGNPTVYKVNSGVDEKEPALVVRFLVPLTRPGKFGVRLKATDEVTKKTATFTLPMTVLPSQ